MESEYKQFKIVCVMPAMNEGEVVADTIKSVRPYVDEIIIVDDGSIDDTAAIATESGAIVLKHIINRGQGAALQTGDEQALKTGADIIVHFDADGQFIAEEIKDIIEPILRGQADVVLGSRFLGKKSNMHWLKKNILFPIARIVNRVLGGVKLSDPQSGFRAMSSAVAKTIEIQNDGSAHCSEIIYKIFKKGYRVKEVPITVIYKNFGQSLFSGRGRAMGGTRIIKDIIISKLIE